MNKGILPGTLMFYKQAKPDGLWQLVAAAADKGPFAVGSFQSKQDLVRWLNLTAGEINRVPDDTEGKAEWELTLCHG